MSADVPKPVTEGQFKDHYGTGKDVSRMAIYYEDSALATGWVLLLWLSDGTYLAMGAGRGGLKTWSKLDTLIAWIKNQLPDAPIKTIELRL